MLKSSAAKFMGVIGWSELGLGYFLSNLLILDVYKRQTLFGSMPGDGKESSFPSVNPVLEYW